MEGIRRIQKAISDVESKSKVGEAVHESSTYFSDPKDMSKDHLSKSQIPQYCSSYYSEDDISTITDQAVVKILPSNIKHEVKDVLKLGISGSNPKNGCQGIEIMR